VHAPPAESAHLYVSSSAQFDFTPVGPLHQHLELVAGLDAQFGQFTLADAVETMLKSEMETFLVGSVPDLHKIEAILKAHNRNDSSKVVKVDFFEAGASGGGGGGGAKPRKRRHNITVRLVLTFFAPPLCLIWPRQEFTQQLYRWCAFSPAWLLAGCAGRR
jgi:hypothetical protein